MNEDAVRVHRVDFRAVFPSLRIFEALRAAVSPTCLALSLACILTLNLASRLFQAPVMPGKEFTALLQDFNSIASTGFGTGFRLWSSVCIRCLIVTFFCTAIARTAGVRVCEAGRSGPLRSIAFACRSWLSILILSALFFLLLLLNLAFLRCGQGLTRLLAGETSSGAIFATPSLVTGVVFVLGSVTILSAWLLSAPAVSIDRCDGPESLSRGICYVLSRPLRTLLTLACNLGLAFGLREVSSWLLIRAFVLHNLAADPEEAGSIGLDGFEVFRATLSEAVFLSGMGYGLTITYILLRHFEDGAELFEISHDAETSRGTSGLIASQPAAHSEVELQAPPADQISADQTSGDHATR